MDTESIKLIVTLGCVIIYFILLFIWMVKAREREKVHEQKIWYAKIKPVAERTEEDIELLLEDLSMQYSAGKMSYRAYCDNKNRLLGKPTFDEQFTKDMLAAGKSMSEITETKQAIAAKVAQEAKEEKKKNAPKEIVRDAVIGGIVAGPAGAVVGAIVGKSKTENDS